MRICYICDICGANIQEVDVDEKPAARQPLTVQPQGSIINKVVHVPSICDDCLEDLSGNHRPLYVGQPIIH